jgi:hypothetical protein
VRSSETAISSAGVARILDVQDPFTSGVCPADLIGGKLAALVVVEWDDVPGEEELNAFPDETGVAFAA